MTSKIDRAILGTLELPKGFGTTQQLKPLLLPGEDRAVCGFDIEADSITAEPFLLGYSTDTFNGHIELTSALSMIDFHTRFAFRTSINFYYNLQYDFEGMLKMFEKDVAVLLYGQTTAFLNSECKAVIQDQVSERLTEWMYKYTYIPKKAFHIKIAGDKKYSYFDLLQYFQMGLARASEKYLPDKQTKDDFKAAYTSKALFQLKSTIELEIIRFEKHIKNNKLLSDDDKKHKIREMTDFFNRFSSAQEYRDTMIKYCVQDSSLCRQLGHIIVKGVNTFVNTKNFNSSASISEYYFRSNGISVPKLAPSVFKEFMKPYYGGRFEAMKKGFFRNVSIYDIKSAYPHAMKDMPILTKNPIIKNSYDYHEEALFGTYCINVEIPIDEYISPLQIRDGLLYFPNGRYHQYYVDKITLQALLDRGVDVELVKSMEIFDDKAQPLLYDLILKLFNIKEDKNNPEVVRLAAKIILNSLYGKFIQLVDDAGLEVITDLLELDAVSPGELFLIMNRYYKRVHTMTFRTGKLLAPQYASYTTAHTRNYLYETATKVGHEKIIGFHTDSIMLLGNDLIETGHKLGDWELETIKRKNVDETITNVPVRDAELWFLKTGMYQVKSAGALKVRARGIGSTKDLLQEQFQVKRRMGLRQAVKRRFEEMNIISEQNIMNNMNADLKRVWNDEITMDEIINEECIDSMPRIIGMDEPVEVNSYDSGVATNLKMPI